MQIEDSDVGIIEKWIEDHWKGEPLCPVCQNNNWTIGKTIAELRPFLKGKLRMGGILYPAVVFTCNVCGNTLLFNAIALGIVEFPPPKEDNGVVKPLEVMPIKKSIHPKEGIHPVAPPKEVIPPKQKEGDDNG